MKSLFGSIQFSVGSGPIGMHDESYFYYDLLSIIICNICPLLLILNTLLCNVAFALITSSVHGGGCQISRV